MADTKALTLLKKTKSVEQRAENYVDRISKSLRQSRLQRLEENIAKLEDKIQDLSEISLEGDKKPTKEELQKNFDQILDFEYEIVLLKAELKAKTKNYNKYFK